MHIFPHFFPLSLLRHSLGYHVAFSCHVTLAFSHLTVSQSLSFMNLTFWKIGYFHEYRYFFLITVRL